MKNLEFFSWKKALLGKNEIEKLSLQLAIPSFAIKKLVAVMDFDSIRANVRQMDYREDKTTFFFRINELVFEKTQKDTKGLILAELKKQGIIVKQDTHFSNIFRTNFDEVYGLA